MVIALPATAALAACLVGAATVAAGRWGHRVGGVVSAFPMIAGPVLLLAAERHGPAFAARAAAGTLLGLVALSGFAVAYARCALRHPWWACAGAGWLVAAALGVLVGRTHAGMPVALAAATVSLVAARWAVPSVPAAPVPRIRFELPLRMAVTVLLIVLLDAAGSRFGPTMAGVLAALPALASVLAVFTHRRHGPAALLALMRGMLGGMAAFVTFCAIVGALVEHAGTASTFLLATGAAVVAEAVVAAEAPAAARYQRRPPVRQPSA